jgi:hypothetical protein
VYQKVFSRYQRLLGVADLANSDMDKLDYDEQEKAKQDVQKSV